MGILNELMGPVAWGALFLIAVRMALMAARREGGRERVRALHARSRAERMGSMGGWTKWT